jgi:hypothetical protein
LPSFFFFFAYLLFAFYVLAAFLFPWANAAFLKMTSDFVPVLPGSVIECFLIVNAIALFLVIRRWIMTGMLLLFLSDTVRFIVLLCLGVKEDLPSVFLSSYLALMVLATPLILSLILARRSKTGAPKDPA